MRKLDSLAKENKKLNDGADVLKSALTEIQGVFLQPPSSQKEDLPDTMKPSRLALAFIDSRITEAEAIRRVRTVGRAEVELRERLKQM